MAGNETVIKCCVIAHNVPLLCRLRDESSHVRKNTLMVLTHLILNDMVKVKGQISEMATCLEDKDSRISDLAKLFFLELSKKVRISESTLGLSCRGGTSKIQILMADVTAEVAYNRTFILCLVK